MAEKLPELAVDNDFSSEATDADEEGIYRIVEYRRKDRSLYMRSELSNRLEKGIYGLITLTYYDQSGEIPLHHVNWRLEYDVNRKIVSKQRVR